MEEKNLTQLVRQGMKKNITKAQIEALDQLEVKEQTFIQANLELQIAKAQLEEKQKLLTEKTFELENAKIEANKQKEILKGEIARFGDIENRFITLEKKVNTAYTAKDLSNYLNQVIKEFNESKASDNNMATYIINNMDVDLKVRIYGDDQESIRFSAPNITETTEDSLSSIKISIQAIPK